MTSAISINEYKSFYKNKNVFVTGHTGFKGSWLSMILSMLGANVTGYALEPPTNPSLFDIAGIGNGMHSVIGDIRDKEKLQKTFDEAKPDIVLHLAAQPIVKISYEKPRETYETNVMGTVNLMECVRESDTVRSLLNVTTDKVYLNREWAWGYRENEMLDGYDPYSNSKSCSELVTHSYARSFFGDMDVAVSTARAGNVIGGGDFSPDRIIPDCVRAALKNEKIIVRNKYSIRPYQHVLEPLFAYLMIAMKQYSGEKYAGAYNVGPDDVDNVRTGELADIFCREWGGGLTWVDQTEKNAPHEANILRLDTSKIKMTFGWRPHWHIEDAVRKTVDWSRAYKDDGDVRNEMYREINEYMRA